MEHSTPHCETFNIQYRYCDERDYRLYACGITTTDELRSLVSFLAGLEERYTVCCIMRYGRHNKQHVMIKVISLWQTEEDLVFGSFQTLAAILVVSIDNLYYLKTDKNSINHKTLFLILCKGRTLSRHKQAKGQLYFCRQTAHHQKHTNNIFCSSVNKNALFFHIKCHLLKK